MSSSSSNDAGNMLSGLDCVDADEQVSIKSSCHQTASNSQTGGTNCTPFRSDVFRIKACGALSNSSSSRDHGNSWNQVVSAESVAEGASEMPEVDIRVAALAKCWP